MNKYDKQEFIKNVTEDYQDLKWYLNHVICVYVFNIKKYIITCSLELNYKPSDFKIIFGSQKEADDYYKKLQGDIGFAFKEIYTNYKFEYIKQAVRYINKHLEVKNENNR